MIGPLFVSPCRERPPRCTRSTDNALCEWCQIGNSAATERGSSQLSYCRMRQFADKGHTDQSCLVKLPRHWTRSPPEIVFNPAGSGTPIHVFKLLKDLGVQADNVFSPSAQCNQAANKARRVVFAKRRSFFRNQHSSHYMRS